MLVLRTQLLNNGVFFTNLIFTEKQPLVQLLNLDIILFYLLLEILVLGFLNRFSKFVQTGLSGDQILLSQLDQLLQLAVPLLNFQELRGQSGKILFELNIVLLRLFVLPLKVPQLLLELSLLLLPFIQLVAFALILTLWRAIPHLGSQIWAFILR